MSQGLVLHAPEGSKPGDDVAELLGIVHYVPPEDPAGMGEFIADPPTPGEKYDVDSWYRYGSHFPPCIHVEITEKINGANTKFSYQKGKLWAGSRNHWLKEDKNCMFWRVMHNNPWLQRLCKQNPDCIIYGETFGNVQSLKYARASQRYGAGRGEYARASQRYVFRVFDILTPKGYMGYLEKDKELNWTAWPQCRDLAARIPLHQRTRTRGIQFCRRNCSALGISEGP